MSLQFYKRRKKIKLSLINEIFVWLIGIVVSIFLAGFIVFTVGVRVNVVGNSMSPILSDNDTILINTMMYNLREPKSGEVIAFLPNGNTSSHYYVKRVVAVSGDTIIIKDGLIYVNDEIYKGNYVEIKEPGIAESEITLGKNEYFVIGDDINNSEDSRSGNIGLVERDTILGKVWLRLKNDENILKYIK